MDACTKNAAVAKAKSIAAVVAFPNELINKTALENHYIALKLNDTEYFMNALRLRKFHTDYYFYRLREPINKIDWVAQATPTTINAFYNLLENSIREYALRLK